ncbi:unnamed protein product [Coregonus sp. 'balchen']|nr:unnamed protein product [Coregonus sp. 'balchen']
MAGQQFQYDDSGNTFFYFLTSFVGLIVIPATYYLWPRDQNAEQLRLKSLRRVHGRCLWYRLRLTKSQQSIIPTLNFGIALPAWIVDSKNSMLVLLVYGLAFMVILPVVVRFVVRKSPALLQEMVNVGCQLTMMANSRGGFHAPRLVSIENCMKLTQMIYKVRSLQDLVSLKDSDRRSMLRFLGEEKYDEVMAVLASFPHITMETKLQVLDDEDSNNITAGSIVTVTQGDASKTKAKVWQSKTKAAKKTKQSKKKKLTKKKPLPLPAVKAKQANGSASGSEWEALQQSIQRRERALLETKSKVTHPVYSLYYPEEKHEWWWLYIADRKDQTLVSMPYHVCTLKDTEELEVHEAKAVLDNHPQWDIPETEEEDEEQEDSDGIEESEEEDEDND